MTAFLEVAGECSEDGLDVLVNNADIQHIGTLADVDWAARASYQCRLGAGGVTGEPVTGHTGPTS